MKLAEKYRTILNRNDINTPLRLAHFFGQLHYESGLRPISENLNYSASALKRVFRKYFPNDTLANYYAYKPEKIANRVYADRMGNGNESSGDGWRYRGRGFIQITGKANYRMLSEDTGIDYVNNPDLLLNEADSMVAAIWYWSKNNLNDLADLDDVKRITKKINGGYNGIGRRAKLVEHYKDIFNDRN